MAEITEMDEKLLRVRHRPDWLIPFAMALVVMFAYAYTCRQLDFRGDALETWKLAKSFWDPTGSPRSYVEYRGFLIFAINALIFKLSEIIGSHQVLTLRFFTSLLFAAMSAISIPTLISRISGVSTTLLRRMLCVVVVFYFFRGHFLYPSTDAISLWFTVLAFNAGLRGDRLTIGNALLAGAWIGCAVLCRGNYIIVLPILVLFAFRDGNKFSRPSIQGLIRVAAILAPFIVLLAINSQYQVDRTRVAGPPQTTSHKILVQQLTVGLRSQRIEWRMGGTYPSQPLWTDPRGRQILEMEGKQDIWIELKDYVSILSRHPFGFAEIYARHLFNGLDISYPAVYVPDVAQRSAVFSLLNYLLIFASILLIARDLRDSKTRMLRLSVLSALFLPALACMPFQVEPRFFISMGLPLLAYPTIASTRFRWGTAHLKYLVAAVLFVVACFALSAHIFQSLDGQAPLPFHTFP